MVDSGSVLRVRADTAGISVSRDIEESSASASTRKQAASTTDSIMARAVPANQVAISKSKPGDAIAQSKTGWIYLGHFDARNSTWKTRYLDFPANARPSEFVGKSYPVRERTGALNVRQSSPDTFGNFGSVVDVLQVGSSIAIEEVREWHSTGYMWARSRYTPSG